MNETTTLFSLSRPWFVLLVLDALPGHEQQTATKSDTPLTRRRAFPATLLPPFCAFSMPNSSEDYDGDETENSMKLTGCNLSFACVALSRSFSSSLMFSFCLAVLSSLFLFPCVTVAASACFGALP